ncbi:MAG: type I DNA topoisomerase [Pirellulales bacterium]
MAKKSPASVAKSLVIVESPAKARTISKFLGNDYVIEASIGHVRDLPEGKKQVPAQFRDEAWAYLGVNVDQDFEPVYVVPPGKTQHIRKLRDLVKGAKALYLATDEDREGEAISWHLQELLKPKVPVHRMVFHEITQEAIEEAINHLRTIDNDLVKAQETRRILDRLYGYDVSPLLWRKMGRRLSAGRVQSVAVRLIVERERDRMAFVSATYWDLLATFAKQQAQADGFEATLVSVDERKLPSTGDFDAATGKIKDPALLLLDEAGVRNLVDELSGCEFRVASLEEKPYTTKPYPPFTTSTLQQEANRKLGFTARRTMGAAQSLYENGHITYMRTDSTNLAKTAVDAARDLVKGQYGADFLSPEPRTYATKVKNAQEAHEAIRPAGHPFDFPDALRKELRDDEFKLYDMIWKRTVASQMADARGRRISITIQGGGAVFRVGGKVIDFPGYLRAYVEGSDDPQAELAERDTILPDVAVGELLDLRQLDPKSHTTQPPARFTEATLTKSLEDKGIGRPSTYASIIDTILAREYVFKRGNALVPTWVGFAVCQLMEKHLPELVDYAFTARMEDDLDAISRGESGHVQYLKSFYHGGEKPGLKKLLANKLDEIDVREVSRIFIGQPEHNGQPGEPVFVRVGKYGPFLEHGERRASLPPDTAPDEVKLPWALDMLERAVQAEEPIGMCPDTHLPIYLKQGRFGPYIQRGTPEDEQKKNASLMKGMKPEDVDLAVALRLLSLPRTLGERPADNLPIVAQNGRFGPYIKCGDDTRSLPADISPLDITLEQALELLAQPKAARRGFGAPREPLKAFDPSPVTKQPIQLFDGRYGLYVTDGETNASLPKGETAETLTHAQALELLAARAALGPSKKKKKSARGAKKAAKKESKKATKKTGEEASSTTAAQKPAKAKKAKKKSTKKKAVKKKAPKEPGE